MGREYPGEGAINYIYIAGLLLFSNPRKHQKDKKNIQKVLKLLDHKRLFLDSMQEKTNGGRVEIGLPCLTSYARGPLRYRN